MLFQGTEKYPDENEYNKYISDNAGTNNAYTDLVNTNFHFDCANNAFEGALDRLAQFFISPTFSEKSSEKEMKAVDSEFNQSLQDDGWHQQNLGMHLSHPDSKYNIF